MLSGTTCTGANNYVPESNYARTSITTANFQAQCCTTRPLCSSKTCTAGTELVGNPTTTYFIDASGSNCCPVKTGTCLAAFGAGCTTNTKYLPASNYGTMSTDEATCCLDQPTCGNYDCNTAIYTANAGTTRCTTGTCSVTACCTPKTTTCFGAATTGYTCPTGYSSIKGVSGATNAASTTINAQTCCEQKAKCSNWWYATSSAAAVRPALATVVVGAIASFMLL